MKLKSCKKTAAEHLGMIFFLERGTFQAPDKVFYMYRIAYNQADLAIYLYLLALTKIILGLEKAIFYVGS
jgi:hypothetical protein